MPHRHLLFFSKFPAVSIEVAVNDDTKLSHSRIEKVNYLGELLKIEGELT